MGGDDVAGLVKTDVIWTAELAADPLPLVGMDGDVPKPFVVIIVNDGQVPVVVGAGGLPLRLSSQFALFVDFARIVHIH